MPSFEVEFEVFCGSCGEGLCQQSVGENTRAGLKVTVQPCEECLKKAKEKGYDEGWDKGYTEGYDEGSRNK